MNAAPKSKTASSASPSKVEPNKVHELISRLARIHDAEQKKIKEDFANVSFSGIAEIVAQLTASEDVPLDSRIQALGDALRLISNTLDGITPRVPMEAPLLWRDRPENLHDMSPCDFVVVHYPSYGYGLTMADIRHIDTSLYMALHNLRRRHGWPDGFHLPTRKQHNDEALSAMSDDEVTRNKRIAYAAHHRQRIKSSPTR